MIKMLPLMNLSLLQEFNGFCKGVSYYFPLPNIFIDLDDDSNPNNDEFDEYGFESTSIFATTG